MASYWRKKQKTDANVTSVIIVVAHVFLERKPMAGLFQNDFLLCFFRTTFGIPATLSAKIFVQFATPRLSSQIQRYIVS